MALIDSPSGPRPAEPGLESALVAGEHGAMTMEEVLRIFAAWPVFVPSQADPASTPDGIQPVIVESAEGTSLVAVFTSEDRIQTFAEEAPHLVQLAGATVAAASRGGAGIVINPRSGPGFEVFPAAIPVVQSFPRLLTSLSSSAERPLLPVEVAVASWAAHHGSNEKVSEELTDAHIVVPAGTSTLTLDGVPYAVGYTADDLVRSGGAVDPGEWLRLRGREFSERFGDDCGLALNRGSAIAMGLTPQAMQALRKPARRGLFRRRTA